MRFDRATNCCQAAARCARGHPVVARDRVPIWGVAAGLGRRLLQHGIEARTTRSTALLAPGADLPSPALHASLLEPLGPGGSRRCRTATFDVRTEQARAGSLLLAPPATVPVFDGVFLLRDARMSHV